MTHQNPILAAYQLGLPVTTATRAVRCNHQFLIVPIAPPLEPFLITGYEPPWPSYYEERIDLGSVACVPGIEALGYSKDLDMVAWKPFATEDEAALRWHEQYARQIHARFELLKESAG